MASSNKTVYPYIPNSVPTVKRAMLASVGAESVEALYADIPQDLRFKGQMQIPAPFLSEARLKRHVEGVLKRNTPSGEALSFLGAGSYHHHVPSLCDEINGRSEFLTAYAGEPYDDHGRFQALWEYTSMMGELLNMDVVCVPNYDGFQAAATAARMAGRHTGRRRILVAGTVNPAKRQAMATYGRSDLDFVPVPFDAATGLLDRNALKKLLEEGPAAGFYLDQPSYLGMVEDGQAIGELVKARGALFIVGVDPSTLGVVTPPADYGADIACGDIQPLGIHMNWGGGHGGFIASQDDQALVMQYPNRLFGITPTEVPGQYGFGDVAYVRTSFDRREEGNEFVGTAAALWGITAGVYLACMGPQGMVELGEGLMARCQYAKDRLATVPGLKVLHRGQSQVKEFAVSFDGTGKTVAQVNEALLARNIFGGRDLSGLFPELGQSALFCFTELHTQEDIDTLVKALQEVTR